MEWAGVRMCTTANDFFDGRTFDRATDKATFASTSDGYRNATVVLNCFRHTYEEDGVNKVSFGLVLTTRRLFRNVMYAVESQQEDGVFAATDGMYKIHFGNWVLVALGSYSTRFTNEHKYSKHFVP